MSQRDPDVHIGNGLVNRKRDRQLRNGWKAVGSAGAGRRNEEIDLLGWREINRRLNGKNRRANDGRQKQRAARIGKRKRLHGNRAARSSPKIYRHLASLSGNGSDDGRTEAESQRTFRATIIR